VFNLIAIINYDMLSLDFIMKISVVDSGEVGGCWLAICVMKISV
jgi:hypothetical protein